MNDELLIANFTGSLTRYYSTTLRRWFSFQQPYPRVEQHQGYVLRADQGSGKIMIMKIWV